MSPVDVGKLRCGQVHDARVRFDGETFPLAQDGREGQVAEKMVNEVLGTFLVFVRGNREVNPVGVQVLQYFRDARVGPGKVAIVGAVIGEEALGHLLHIFFVDRLGRERFAE